MCFPGWEDDGIFSNLIGGGGEYTVTPEGRYVWGGYYEPGTLVWHSRWVTGDATIECREALALPSNPHRALILRRISALERTARLRVCLHPRSDWGRTAPGNLRRGDGGDWTARLGDVHLRWLGGGSAQVGDEGELAMDLVLQQGQHHDLLLELDVHRPADLPDPDRAWVETENAWRERVPELGFRLAERDARHAVAVLTGLTSQRGGMVAAATTSLPERYREGRNYDYRYAWIRDQCYAGHAAAAAGLDALLDQAVGFVGERLLADGPGLRPAYTVEGGRIPELRRLDLPGYPGGTDLIGNRVTDQFQLDPFGEALLLFASAASRDRLGPRAWRAAAEAAAAIERCWQRPDAGIWELDPARWTHSRLICAAGLRALARHLPGAGGRDRWLSLADRIRADAEEWAVHPSGRWQRSDADPGLDAALLLAGIRGAPAGDPRTAATLSACERSLTEDGYAYRYRPDRRPLGEAEGSFLLCGFLFCLAHLHQGNRERAARWFERTRAASGPSRLLAEEFDVDQAQLRGNLPQAFVHALLLECAAHEG
jgi:GH15 family glucan-1,4-alpha-glucosidase